MGISERLDIVGVTRAFGPLRALDEVSLDVAPGEFVSILGPSGCGKSTLLRTIAGLEAADSGTIRLGGTPIEGLRPKDREIAFVFQSYALYPHLTCRANIAAPLAMRELSGWGRAPLLHRLVPGARRIRAGIDARVEAIAAQLQITDFLDRRPSALSGGQRQRVALGRALIREPKLFLLDEPLANLDAALRNRTRGELHDLQRRVGATTLFVTHDQSEAMAISDRIAVMFAGRIAQVGTPDDLYRAPASLAVAQFLSQPHLNVIDASLAARTVQAVRGKPLLAFNGVVAFRPEHASVHHGSQGGLRATVERAEHAGADANLFVRLDADGTGCVVRIPSGAIADWRPGAPATLHFDPDAAWVFPHPDGAEADRKVA